MKRLQDIDLNLLLVFQLMYRERNTSKVAELLDLSQPAVSNALGRLRRTLDDELFVRSSRGMEPTSLADQLAEPMFYALSTIEHSINVQDSFHPASSERVFCIAMSDIGEIYFLPRLIRHLAQTAPGVRLQTIRPHATDLKRAMERGGVDLAIGLLGNLTTGFYQRRLFSQRYVCLMRKDHPLAKQGGTLDKEAFLRAEQAVVVAEGTGHEAVEQIMVQQGLPQPVRLRIPHFVAVPYILWESDLVVTVPEKLAQGTAEPMGLTYREHPLTLPPIQINQFWHRRFHQDMANQWLRRLVVELFAE